MNKKPGPFTIPFRAPVHAADSQVGLGLEHAGAQARRSLLGATRGVISANNEICIFTFLVRTSCRRGRQF